MLEFLQRVAVVLTLVGGAAFALSLEDHGLLVRLRRRFVLGVPWGTVVTVLGVLAVYLFVQGGYTHWYRPVVIPFRAWSYLAPLGMLTAGFAHAGPGHLLGNLFGTVALAPIVEYAFGHFPRERGASSFGSLQTNPYVRALLVFPATVAIVGVTLTLFTLGPVIGFSGVVFAFAGFALVRYPFGTVLALVGSDVIGQTYRALQNPTSTVSGRSVFITPWWSNIAIQGHAIGLLVGVLLGAVYLRHSEEPSPSPARLWAGVVLVGTMQSLWAVYWYRGGTEFVLFRALGTVIVAVTAVLIVVSVAGSDQPLVERFGALLDRDGNGPEEAADGDWASVSARQVGATTLVLVAALLAGPAIPVNLLTTAGGVPGDPVTVDGYEVTYAENVTNGMVSAIPVEAFGESTQVNTSGVIVRNEDRNIWITAVSKGKLASSGRARVVVGGVGWRHELLVTRGGWQAVDGGTAYRVRLTHDGRTRTAYTSGPARADLRLAGNNVSVVPENGTFVLSLTGQNRTLSAPIPQQNSSVTLGNVTFIRENAKVVASYDGTRVTVLRKERYN